MNTSSTVEFTMLDVSTAHLSPETRQRLETFDVEGVLYYPKGPWGWFVNVPDREDGLVVGDEVPKDLKACIQFAQTLEKEWIMFDCDGTIMEDLPKFDDEKLPSITNHHVLQQLAQNYARHLSVRHGRNVKAMVTGNGKIRVKDDQENGLSALLTPEFVQAILLQHQPATETDIHQVVAG
ncbi:MULTISPECIES: DUF5983 family protein [Polaromonas]|uniref:DUF5983 domain-containing protein n=1 Tax=Polaromonas aquatica TaxID=332657 RepID=A0ABW1TWY8_9BURK